MFPKRKITVVVSFAVLLMLFRSVFQNGLSPLPNSPGEVRSRFTARRPKSGTGSAESDAERGVHSKQLEEKNDHTSQDAVIWIPKENQTFGNFTKNKFTDILSAPPVHFLENFKNPCWMERISEPTNTSVFVRQGDFFFSVKCLPYFFIAGFPKCGTSDLYNRLRRHPDIVRPCTKEPHWWNRGRLHRRSWSTMEWYLSCFSPATQYIVGNNHSYTLITSQRHNKVTMDCSAGTIWDQANWKAIPQNDVEAEEPRTTSAQSIHHLLPDTKFIVLLRNPTDRLFSDYNYFTSGSLNATDFHQRATDSVARLKECFASQTVRSCLYNKELLHSLKARVYIGVYSLAVAEFLKQFPREQFLFLKSEEYSVDVTNHLFRVFTFLDVEFPSEPVLRNMTILPKSNTRKKKAVKSMLPETRELLDEFYAPFNAQLVKLLGDSRFSFEAKGA